jgi:hypothetical protein
MARAGAAGMVEQAWRPAARLLLYYLALLVAYFALDAVFPWVGERLGEVPRPVAGGIDLTQPIEPYADSPGEAGAGAVLSMVAAFLLALPVVWVYTFARQKRGFQQSLAQTLVILPIVVAVVVVLVKHSVALAFSLGGIVGAVAFRHRLEDTKDAVYIFVTIAIGLAVGVQAYSVGFAASVVYNLIALGLWVTDFARAPAPLAPEIAQRRVQLVKEISADKRTGEYVAQLDQHLLQSMTPEQLKALAARALERTAGYQREAGEPVAADPRDTTLGAVTAVDNLVGVRAAIELVLERDAKAWWFDGESPADNGSVMLRYRVRCRKRIPPATLLESVRRAVAPLTQDVAIQ